MTRRLPVSPAPGPLEDYGRSFDDLFGARAQREGFRRYLEGLLLTAERNKTSTALAKAPSRSWERSERRREACDGSFLSRGGILGKPTSVAGIWALADRRRRRGVDPDQRRSSSRVGGKGEKGGPGYPGRRP
jgi:hypothetical protein